MAQITWILDSGILERLTSHKQKLPDIIEAQGHRVLFSERLEDGSFTPVEVEPTECVVLFGSHSFVKAINPDGRFQPGALGVNSRTTASSYMSNLPLDWFMNRKGVFMTWAMFKEHGKEYLQNLGHTSAFIRPNSGLKTFAGQVIKVNDWDDTIQTLDQLSSVMLETMIMVSPTESIAGEFRFVIADGKVVTGSEYRWDGKLDVRIDYPLECFELAQRVAEHPWQVDIAYTCDVALLDDGPKLVELNGFSCAGLYACDLEKVVKHVSAVAWKEFTGAEIG